MEKHYKTLGLKEDASQEEIQEAYERLSNTLDPKKNDNLDFFIEEYGLVQEAYKFLKKEIKKKAEPKQIAADSIESVFETYKRYDTAKKIDFLKELEDKINSGSQNYKIALNIICKYESCDNLEQLIQKLKPTPKEIPKETTKVVSKPAKTSIKEKENSQKVIAVTDSDTSSTLINKYNEAPKESKEGVLALFKVLGTTGHKECLLALHELLGEPLDLDENLLVMIVQGIASNPQASNTSSIKEGKGEFGLSKTNPIPVYGIPSNEIYLKQLKTNLGGKITWKRKGSIKVKEIEKEIDEYLIFDEKGKKIATFFISPYHWKTSKKFPKGFIHVNEVPSNNKNSTNKSSPKPTTTPKPLKPKNQSKEPASNKKKNTNKVVLISFISLISLVLMYLFSLKPEKNSSFPKKTITKESKVKTIPKKLSDIEIQFKANTDTTSYKLNQTIQLEFTLSQDASSFIPPSFEDFNVLAGPSQNISNTWQSGKYSYKKTYKYELSPKKTGQFVIAPASIDYMGYTFVTDSIFIKVLPKTRAKKRRKKKPKVTYDSEYYNKLGLKNFEKEEYENALINFSKASELDPKVGAYYYSIGIVKTYLDDKVGACYQFSKALKYGYEEAQKVIESYCNKKEEEKIVYVSVKGKIEDHKNRTVINAKVTNKTTGESVSVNFDGEYSLKAKEGDVILFEHEKSRRYPSIVSSYESSYGNIINVKFLKKRKLKLRIILKKWDPKYKAYSKAITSKN